MSLAATVLFLSCFMVLCFGCDYFIEGPIVMSDKNKVVNNIFISDVSEISFELRLYGGCPQEWCDMFQIGDNTPGQDISNRRVPLFSINGWGNNYLHVVFSTNSYWNFKINYYNSNLTSTIVDGNYHKIYTKFSDTERIVIFEDTVYGNTTYNPKEDRSNVIYIQYPLWIPLTLSELNGTFKNICINTTTYPRGIDNQLFIEQSVLTPLEAYKNGINIETLNKTEANTTYYWGYQWQINNTDQIGYNLKISMNDTSKWSFNATSISSLQLVINNNYFASSIEHNLLITFSISSIKYFAIVINMDAYDNGTDYNRIYPLCDTNLMNPQQMFAVGDAEMISNVDNGQSMIYKIFGNETNDPGNEQDLEPPILNSGSLILNIINHPAEDYSIFKLTNSETNVVQSCGFGESIKKDDYLDIFIAATEQSEIYAFTSFIINKYILPTSAPSRDPTLEPTLEPTLQPVMPTIEPTIIPSLFEGEASDEDTTTLSAENNENSDKNSDILIFIIIGSSIGAILIVIGIALYVRYIVKKKKHYSSSVTKMENIASKSSTGTIELGKNDDPLITKTPAFTDEQLGHLIVDQNTIQNMEIENNTIGNTNDMTPDLLINTVTTQTADNITNGLSNTVSLQNLSNISSNSIVNDDLYGDDQDDENEDLYLPNMKNQTAGGPTLK